MKKLIVAALACAASLFACAEDYITTDDKGQSLKWTFTANRLDVATAGDAQDYQATITAVEPIPVTRSVTKIEIPAYLGTYRVTRLGGQVFRAGCTNVTEVVFPEEEADEPTIMLTSTTMGTGNAAFGNTAWWRQNRGNSPIVLNGFYLLSCGTNRYNDVNTGNARVICTGAFNANATNKVSISTSVEDIWIGPGAFDGFRGKELVIPDNVTRISPKPIQNCALDYLKLGNGITELPHDINSTANNHWKDLFNNVKKLELPESITEIPAFRGGAPDNDPPNQDPSIDVGYFQGCTSLTNVILGAEVTKIANRAFSGCTGLKEITVPDTLEEIGDEAFRNCTALERFISFPESLEVMGQAAFQNCSKLGDVSLPEGITEIRDYCFDGCSALSNLTIGAGVEFIGIQAFQNCDKVISVEIPESVYMIDSAAFNGCNILTNVTGGASLEMVLDNAFVGTPFAWCKSGKFEVSAIGPFIVGFKGVCPAKLDLEKEAPEALAILDGAFNRLAAQTNVTEIVFPETLEYIGKSAFSSIRAVATLTLPDSLIEIDDSAFFNMTNLSEVVFGSDLERIGASAFQRCGKIKSLEFPDTLEVIEDNAFNRCTNLSEIVSFGSALEEIGDNAFQNCWWLTGEEGLEFPESLETLGDDAFQNCSNLVTVVLNDNLSIIGDRAFQDCRKLKEVSFGSGLERIGAQAFERCWELGAAEFGDKLWQIGKSAFSLCSNLNEVVAGDALMYVRDNAFLDAMFIREKSKDNKESLVQVGNILVGWRDIAFDAEIEVADGVTGIAEGAFRNCLMKKVTLPKSVEYIHSLAFDNCTNLHTVVIGNWNVRRKGPPTDANYSFKNAKYKGPTGAWIPAELVISKPGYTYSGNWSNEPAANMVVASREDGSGDAWEVIDWTKVKFRTDPTQDGDFVPGQTYTGWLRAGNQAAGTVTVKTGKVDKDGFVKVSVTVQFPGVKKSFTELVPWTEGKLVGRTVLQNVTLGGSWLTGSFTYDGVTYNLEGGTDIGKANPAYFDAFNGRVYAISFATGGISTRNDASANGLPLVWGDSSLVLTCSKKGKVKVSGMLGDGTKVSASAQAVAGDNGAFVAPVCLQLYGGKRGGFNFLAWFYLDEDGSPTFYIDETEGQVGNWVYPLEFAWDPYAYIALNVQAFGEVDKANVSGLKFPEFHYTFTAANPVWDSVRDVIGPASTYIGAWEFDVTETAMRNWNNNWIGFFANEKGKWTLPEDNGASKITFQAEPGKYAADVARFLWNDVEVDVASTTSWRAWGDRRDGCFTSDGKWIQRLYYRSNNGEAALEEDGQILGYYVIDVGLKSKDVGLYQTDADRQQLMTKRNLGGLKLSYAPKTGMYSGSYTLYSVDDIKNPAKLTLRKTKVTVSGVMIDGVGYGTAVASKLFSAPSHIQVSR